MSTSSIHDLSIPLQAVLGSALETGVAQGSAAGPLEAVSASPARFKPDLSQLSPFVQLHALDQLQQSDPERFQQVTKEISANLQQAAQAAQATGDTNQAGQLAQLADDFSHASESGQIPDLRDLAQTVTGTSPPGPSAEAAGPDSGSGYSSGSANDTLGIVVKTLEQYAGSPSPAT